MRWNLFLLAGAANLLQASAADTCSCGYFDRSSGQIFTESIIVYFNETQSIPEDVFSIQSFAHKSEKGWNSLYRQGAATGNSLISNPSSDSQALDLWLDPSDKNHIVSGGSIKSKRQDILHGTFRASMRGPAAWNGGSALSMMLQFNESSSMEIDMLNGDNSDNARFSTLLNGEYPSEDLGLNYSTVEKGDDILAPVDPWSYVTLRMDWSDKHVNFTIAENMTRSIFHKKENLPTEPLPLLFKHWSTGDSEWMEGPPKNRTVASVAWVRAFFNSSTTSTSQQRDFDAQCDPSLACDVDDMSLRGSSNYTAASLVAWKEPPRNEQWQMPSGIVAGSSSFFGLVALINVLLRRRPWKKLTQKSENTSSTSEKKNIEAPMTGGSLQRTSSSSTLGSVGASKQKWDLSSPMTASSSTTPWEPRTPAMSRAPSTADFFDVALLRKKMAENSALQGDLPEQFRQIALRQSPSVGSDGWSSVANTLVCPTPDVNFSKPIKSPETIRESTEISVVNNRLSRVDEKKEANITAQELVAQGSQPRPVPQKRIDYLAGLVTLSCIGVTLIHFTLTFIPYAGGLGYGRHYKSELYSRWSATPILLNPIWIGPFFCTSCRFLAGNFLRSGNLSDVAKKMLLRAPRMVMPAIIIAALEYFFIELGLTAKLEWLPSITWSTWPYVTNYPNFGWFLNEALELAYMIPNKAPGIVNHYCVGVLWTIPVQLQFSYTTLLGAVMVREIKTPWKRFAFYTWCIASNWYSMCWGSCFWLGLMIADLNVTYSYVSFLQSRPKYFYPVCLLLWALMIQGPLWTFLEDRGFYTIMTRERNIHPSLSTGLPQGQVSSEYPAYYEPRLNTILFAGAVQMLVELSTSFQSFLSLRVWILLFPHTFTIYLIHGFIFWSFGAWLAVALARLDFLPYWSICLILFLCCYTLIGLVAVFLTPFSEGAAMAICRNCWRWASEEPVPHRRTTAPFRKDLFLNRSGGAVTKDEESAHGPVEVIDEKNFADGGKGKGGEAEGPFGDENEVVSSAGSIRSVKKADKGDEVSPFDDPVTPLTPGVEGLGIKLVEKK